MCLEDATITEAGVMDLRHLESMSPSTFSEEDEDQHLENQHSVTTIQLET